MSILPSDLPLDDLPVARDAFITRSEPHPDFDLLYEGKYMRPAFDGKDVILRGAPMQKRRSSDAYWYSICGLGKGDVMRDGPFSEAYWMKDDTLLVCAVWFDKARRQYRERAWVYQYNNTWKRLTRRQQDLTDLLEGQKLLIDLKTI